VQRAVTAAAERLKARAWSAEDVRAYGSTLQSLVPQTPEETAMQITGVAVPGL